MPMRVEHFDCPLPIRLRAAEARRATGFLIDGNGPRRSARVCRRHGRRLVPDHAVDLARRGFREYCERLRMDTGSGRKNFAIVQAEDELAAIGIVIGAGWNGARAFTATSGPGVSLMSEFLGLAYFAEIPGCCSTSSAPVRRPACRPAPSRPTPRRRLRLARRHQARAAVPVRPERVLRPGRRRLRSRRPPADPGDRDERPRSRHERQCADPLDWDDERRYDRGKVLDAADSNRARAFWPLSRRRRRRHLLPHVSGHPSRQGRLLHPRHSHDETAVYTEDARLRPKHGPP